MQPALVVNGADTVGGSSAGQGNVLAGGSVIGSGSVVQGNAFTDGDLLANVGKAAISVGADLAIDGAVTVGGSTGAPGRGPGNTFTEVDPQAELLEISGSGAVVQGNVIDGDPWGGAQSDGTNVTIGGSATDLGNQIEDDGSSTIAKSAGVLALAGPLLIENNSLQHDQGAGAVDVEASAQRVTVVRNDMADNGQGISFAGALLPDGTYPSDPSEQDPNDYQPYAVLDEVRAVSGGTEVSGSVEADKFDVNHSVTIDFYATCDGTREGQYFLGEQKLNAAVAAVSGFKLKVASMPHASGCDAVTATSTGDDGSTSGFSPTFGVGYHPLAFVRAGVGPTSTSIPIGGTGAGAASASAARAGLAGAAASRVAHGTLDLECPVTTVGACVGTFILKTAGRKPKTIAHGKFTIFSGYVHAAKLTLSGSLLKSLIRAHHLAARLTTTAHDRARHRHHKRRTFKLELVYG